MYFIIPFIASLLTTWLVIKYQHLHSRYSHDSDLSGVQKFHQNSVPRIGGVAIISGGLVGLWLLNKQIPQADHFIFWLIIAIIPVFLGGFVEDLTNKITPTIRLLLAFCSAFIAYHKLDIGLTGVGLAWLDQTIFTLPGVSLIATIFMIGGVTHAANIIDGFNGLLLGFSLIVYLLFAWVAWQVGDQLLLSLMLITAGSVLGLLLFNFPKGKIFTGDGGAYLLGFLFALYSLLLVKRHEEISPWFPLLVLIYPIFETLFSIYRRKFLRGISPGLPDAMHLHTLIYQRLVPFISSFSQRDWKRNAITATIIWLFVLPSMVPAILWKENSLVMIVSTLCFGFYYVLIYFKIVRFKINKPNR